MSDSEEERYGEEEEVEQNISSSSVMQKFRVAGSISDGVCLPGFLTLSCPRHCPAHPSLYFPGHSV